MHRGTGGPPVAAYPPHWSVRRPKRQERSDSLFLQRNESLRSDQLRPEYRPNIAEYRDHGRAAHATEEAVLNPHRIGATAS
jgi:hypothetical protein